MNKRRRLGHWTEREKEIISRVDSALSWGLSLKRWWMHGGEESVETFRVVTSPNPLNKGFSFFGEAPVNGRLNHVMGDVQDLFYDRPKVARVTEAFVRWKRSQVRIFVLKYLLRIMQSQRPAALVPQGIQPSRFFKPVSWCPDDEPLRTGFGYRQIFYKLKDGTVGRFPAHRQNQIIDLLELITTYEWVVLEIRIFDFDLEVRPLGSRFPKIDFPLRELQYAVMSKDFLVDQDDPRRGWSGEYGIGYALIPDPSSGFLAYGPGHFAKGFQLIHFTVSNRGVVRVHLRFLVNRPGGLVNLSLNPIDWLASAAKTFWGETEGAVPDFLQKISSRGPTDLELTPVFSALRWINILSGGQARKKLCLSKEQLEKIMLVKHYEQVYETIEATLFVWRLVSDWSDTQSLPPWVRSGALEAIPTRRL